MLDFLIVLRGEHDRIRALLADLGAAPPETVRRLLAELDHVVRVHNRLESAIVYPAYRRALGTTEARLRVARHIAEHDEVEAMLSRLIRVDPEEGAFHSLGADLRAALERHMDAEEDALFDEAYDLFSLRERERMGEQVLEMRTELEIRGAEALRH